jgi:hypothetical protein
MTGWTLEIPVKKGKYRVEIRGCRIVTPNARGRTILFGLMTPVDTDRVVIRQVDIEISVTAYKIAATITTKTVQCYGAVMAGKTKFGRPPGLFRRGVQCRTAVKGKSGSGELVIPKGSTHCGGIGIVWCMAGKTDFTTCPTQGGKVMRGTLDSTACEEGKRHDKKKKHQQFNQ